MPQSYEEVSSACLDFVSSHYADHANPTEHNWETKSFHNKENNIPETLFHLETENQRLWSINNSEDVKSWCLLYYVSYINI